MALVLLIGSGGREHALAKKLACSEQVERIFCVPGNGGMSAEKKCECVQLNTHEEILKFASDKGVDLAVIGPEKPLAEGIADKLEENSVPAFGFSRDTARLESSKVFARQFMKKHGIQQPEFSVFESKDSALEFLRENAGKKFFIKADELCGGKGAIPAPDFSAAKNALEKLFDEKICGKGERVLVEEWLQGEECTVMAFTDGKRFEIMPASQDHKRLLDGDRGPNTGGMGAYAPAPVFDETAEKKFRKKVLEPTLDGLRREGFRAKGVLYFGLMFSEEKEPFLLEYNARFGDPEAQPVLSLLDSDLFELLQGCAAGSLGEAGEIKWSGENALCVVLSTKGYPAEYGEEHFEISGLSEAERMPGVSVLHAGTSLEQGRFFTHGGRILGVNAVGATLGEAKQRAYSAVEKISFEGMHFRSDIGRRALGVS